MIPVVVYAAKSTQDKHGSIPDQIKDCEVWIAEQGDREVIGIFKDEGFSAYSGNRGPDLARAVEAAVAAAIEHGQAEVVVQHSDRLARGAGDKPDAAESLDEIWHRWRRKNVIMRSCQDDFDLRDAAAVANLGRRHHVDSQRKGIAVSGGHTRRRRTGKSSGALGWGYAYGATSDDPRIVVEKLRPHVIQVFEDVQRYSERRVARGLIERDVPTAKSGVWTGSRVSRIVRSPYYKGIIGEDENGPIRGDHEAIVSDELWARANAALDERSSKKGNQNPDQGRPPKVDRFLLRGMLTCGSCGKPMWTRTHRGHGIYICSTRERRVGETCTMPQVQRNRLDPALFEYFLNIGIDVEATRKQMLNAAKSEIALTEDLLEAAKIEQAGFEGQTERMLDKLGRNVITDDLFDLWKKGFDEGKAATDAEVGQLTQRRETALAAPDDLTDDVLARLASLRAAIAGDVRADEDIHRVRGALNLLFGGFTLHQPGKDEQVRFNADLWLPTADLYLEPRVRSEILHGWVSDARVTPILERIALDLAPAKEPNLKS
jgi:DNA invertase Pin-like site-specific DNA recombinase